jgi:hypothetical protein
MFQGLLEKGFDSEATLAVTSGTYDRHAPRNRGALPCVLDRKISGTRLTVCYLQSARTSPTLLVNVLEEVAPYNGGGTKLTAAVRSSEMKPVDVQSAL